MIRIVATLCILATGACVTSPAEETAAPETPQLEKFQGWVDELRASEAAPKPAGQQLTLSKDSVAPVFSGSAAEGDLPVLEICHELGGQIGVTIWTYTEDWQVGPEHPSINKAPLQPGNCLLASGVLIEAHGDGAVSPELEKAQQWLDARIASLEAEAPSPERDKLLAEFTNRRGFASTIFFAIKEG